MGSEGKLRARTWRSRVIVLEDHDETAQCICKALIEDGKSVKVAKSIEEFETHLQGGSFDAGSVDWNINNVFLGPLALEQLRHYESDAGKLVYSVHADEEQVVQEAYGGGADFVLEKVGDNYDEYLVKVEDAAKLGLSRRIAKQLRTVGSLSAEIEPEHLRFPIDVELEGELYVKARRVALENALAGEESELMELLKHRGWWQVFTPSQYSELQPQEQLAQLFEYVGGTPEELGRILGVSADIAYSLLRGDDELLLADTSLAANADLLLSVLAYLLRLSGYEPELMSHYWKVTNLFAGSLSSPPWDSIGLANYLQSNGTASIKDALFWIRNH